MNTRVRCPGCGDVLLVDEDVEHPDAAVDNHTTSDCSKPDEVVCARLGWVQPERRTERRRQRQRARAHQQRRRKRGDGVAA